MKNLKNISINRNIVTFVTGVVFALLFLQQCNRNASLKQKVETITMDSERNLNNYIAARDTIRTIRTKNGDLISEIGSYEFDISNLNQEQKVLINKYKDILNLNRDLNRVNSLLSTTINIKDSIIANNSISIVDSNTSRLTFTKFDDFGFGNTRGLSGDLLITKLDTGFRYGDPLIKLSQTMTLSAAIEEVDGLTQLKISTRYPGITISEIENINLINNKLNQRNKKKAGWSIGVGVGYGINLNNNQVISTGPSIGVGLYYSPKWLRF